MSRAQELAREAGAAQDEGLTYFEASELQRFATLVIEQEHKRLLEGSGEPAVRTDQHIDGYGHPAYTADQMMAAVLRERERCAQIDELLGLAAIRGQK